MPETLAVSAQGVWKGYGARPVLRNLDIEVRWGEIVVLLGANGSGKTTLMKMLATLAHPDRGEVLIGGLSPRKSATRIRRILGVVTHQPLLYDALSVRENLRFYGRMYGVLNLASRIDTMVDLVGLTARINQRAGTLSHGAQKRLAIARALLHDPPLLLFDEPESGLDPEAVAGFGNLLQAAAERRRTVIMTTHNMEQAVAIADRVVILADGQIVHEENREDLGGSALRLRATFARYSEGAPQGTEA